MYRVNIHSASGESISIMNIKVNSLSTLLMPTHSEYLFHMCRTLMEYCPANPLTSFILYSLSHLKWPNVVIILYTYPMHILTEGALVPENIQIKFSRVWS